MPTIGLATATAALGLDPDLAPLMDALTARGADTRVVCWDDDVAWDRFDAVVMRSTWDYPERLREFLAWIDRVDATSTLLNPLPIVRWGIDKRYLLALAADGVPVVPTYIAGPSDPIELPMAPEVVIKPSISAGSRDTARLDVDDTRVMRLADAIRSSGRDVMIQPYLSAVDTVGEHALVWFGGEFSHAFRKGPLLHVGTPPTEDLFAAEEITPAAATPAQVAVAAAALDSAARHTGIRPLYARVDLVPGPDGSPVVLELELIEPSVYHFTDPTSADRFATTILEHLTQEAL